MRRCRKIHRRRTGLTVTVLQEAAGLLFWVQRKVDDAEAVLRKERFRMPGVMKLVCTEAVQKMDEKQYPISQSHQY